MQAQVQVGSNENQELTKAGEILPQDMAQFKACITLFILQDRDYMEKDKWEAAFTKAWKVTPFQIIRKEDKVHYFTEDDNFSFCQIGDHISTHETSVSTTIYIRLFYEVWMPGKLTGKKIDRIVFARVGLYPDQGAKTASTILFQQKKKTRLV